MKTNKNIKENKFFREGFLFFKANQISLSKRAKSEWAEFLREYDNLKLDEYLPNNGKYRKRTYSEMYYNPNEDTLEHNSDLKSFYQSVKINRAAGGIHRVFAPISDVILKGELLSELIKFDYNQLPISEKDRSYIWLLGIHMIRVITSSDDIGLPAPEGAHQDGHDYVAQHLIKKQNVEGGYSIIFDLDEKPINATILDDDLDTLYLNDRKLKHFATPILPKSGWYEGYRDMLLIDFNKTDKKSE